MQIEMTLADGRGGMNRQAAILMAAMALEPVTCESGVYISTLPYCNCREMGFVLSIRRPGRGEPNMLGGKQIGWRGLDPVNIAFFEHRNSDSLCAIRWEGTLPISGAVTANDIPRDVYPDKWTVTKSWGYLAIKDAINYAHEVFQEVNEAARTLHTAGEPISPTAA